ncbi:retrovirus-related pol polyprotein from transposon TNT 1-94, partial [Tanacetum coccineum]
MKRSFRLINILTSGIKSRGSRRRNHTTWRRPLQEEQRLCAWFVVFYTAVVELTLRVTINNGRRREVKYRQSQEVLVYIPERIKEHGLSSEITQSSGGSSDMSEGSENSGSFENYGSSAVVELTLRVTINNGRRREVKYRQSQEVLVYIPERIKEHGLSSEITQSSGGSSDMSNKVLREVTGETTAAGVWSKLETLYLTKSLANKLYLKKKLYTFYMPTGQKISEHIDEFKKIVLDLANIEVKFEDEDLALLLLTSLPASYEHFVDTLLYGWEALTLEDMVATLNSKEIKERSKAKGDDGEGLYVKGRTDHRDSRQSRGKSRSKSRGGRLKCYICQSEDHLKRNCPKNNRKKSTGYVKKDKQPSSSGSTYDNSEVMMVMSAQTLLDWIMDSGYSYHMIPRVILSGIRKDNYAYSLDGHAMAGELNASVEEKYSLAQVWHKRLGHINEAGLQVLEKQGR